MVTNITKAIKVYDLFFITYSFHPSCKKICSALSGETGTSGADSGEPCGQVCQRVNFLCAGNPGKTGESDKSWRAIRIGMMITGIRKKIDPCHTPGMHIFAIFGMISSQRLLKQDIKK
jgi:hypothetical protein